MNKLTSIQTMDVLLNFDSSTNAMQPMVTFQQMMLEKLDIHMQKSEIESLSLNKLKPNTETSRRGTVLVVQWLRLSFHCKGQGL